MHINCESVCYATFGKKVYADTMTSIDHIGGTSSKIKGSTGYVGRTLSPTVARMRSISPNASPTLSPNTSPTRRPSRVFQFDSERASINSGQLQPQYPSTPSQVPQVPQYKRNQFGSMRINTPRTCESAYSIQMSAAHDTNDADDQKIYNPDDMQKTSRTQIYNRNKPSWCQSLLLGLLIGCIFVYLIIAIATIGVGFMINENCHQHVDNIVKAALSSQIQNQAASAYDITCSTLYGIVHISNNFSMIVTAATNTTNATSVMHNTTSQCTGSVMSADVATTFELLVANNLIDYGQVCPVSAGSLLIVVGLCMVGSIVFGIGMFKYVTRTYYGPKR